MVFDRGEEMKLDRTIGFQTQEEPSPNGIKNDTLLRCHTRRARLYLAEPLTYLHSPVVSIRNSQGYWVGVLSTPNTAPSQKFRQLDSFRGNDRLRIGCDFGGICDRRPIFYSDG
jgi:hypothetical protein